ncbi:hypothetical protein FSP39_017087 [Pinctada imbricata]|uniref:Glucose/Sorbosone dehydrogenase domain-containing protein n=1 Tax=Pinctada imbricata TaxID=66713 RepID=A0AA88XSU8_PINIB|nr:hypothetical protein FSP39_017087 [Pinctada imbricata]
MSAHSFESDAKLEIPGLCPNFCQKFYNDCHQIIKYLGETVYKLYLDSQSEGSKSWCEKVQTFDEDYCFPEVITNKKLTSERSVLAVKSNSEKCVCFKQFEEYEGETTLPVKMQEVDDGSGRLFVAELPGIISVFHPNGSKEKLPFLNITDRIYRQGKNREIGLMSFIFHPSYKSNGKIYVIYAAKGRHTMKLHEFTMTTNNSIKKEREILKTIPPGRWHNLDDLIFGYDGYLYVFNGDGGVQADFFNLAQNTSVFFGKALRIDVDNMSEEKPYAIPPDNPFIEDTAFAPEIYAYGLRNPWRCTLDTGDPVTGENKGRIMCGDVGQGGYEEINIIKKGGNYGWKKKEGFGCFRSNECNDIRKIQNYIFHKS